MFSFSANVDKLLDPKRTLSDYEITEITVVPRGSGRLPQTLSSSDIMALQREEERRKMQAKTGGGVLNLIFRRGRNVSTFSTRHYVIVRKRLDSDKRHANSNGLMKAGWLSMAMNEKYFFLRRG